ncbi:MAG: recombinase B [Cyanobacteria bacterium QH_7_48_89]|nr:MAG: recombinase B [Cyanobacteria bacterium QH_7_48_89]
MLLTDEVLLNYQRCPRRPFLDIYQDTTLQDPEQEFLLKLRRESQVHIAATLAGQNYKQLDSSARDWQARAKETELLMQQGVECIYRGMLLISGSQQAELPTPTPTNELTLVSTPTLLVKQPGASNFGNWMYEPVNIKLGQRAKPEYRIVAAFQAQILAAVQGVWSQTSRLILRQRNSYAVNLDNWVPRMQAVLEECVQMQFSRAEPEVFISRQRCSLCHWHSYCYEIAQSQQHLSLIPGVTPTRYKHLQELGLTTVESLAHASLDSLGDTIGFETAFRLRQQAQSVLENRAILKSASFNYPTIPTADVEFYFDIEAEPERDLNYLLGILVVNRPTKTEQFYPFMAENPEEEKRIWQDFFELVLLYPDAPIFHFSDYEPETIKRLAKQYEIPPIQLDSVLSRLVDLHKRVTTSVTLPVENYSLKSLAKWLGFKWRDSEGSGAQSVCWYDQWLKTGDRALLEAISRYNEDDCRATYRLKDWLVGFLPDAQ